MESSPAATVIQLTRELSTDRTIGFP